MYFSNSQARRDLPTPATPETRTRRAEWRSAVRVEELLHEAELSVAADEGCFETPGALPSRRRWRRPASLWKSRTGSAFPFSVVLAGVGVGDRRRGGGPRRLVDIAAPRRSHRLDPGGRVDPVANDEALFGGLCRGCATGHDPHSGLKVRCVLGSVGRNGRDELEAGTHGALGVVFPGDGSPPDRHDGVADELLDDAAVPGDDRPGELEVAGQKLPDIFGVFRLGERGEADEVAEQHRDMAQLGGQ